jgi:hypothetical protein
MNFVPSYNSSVNHGRLTAINSRVDVDLQPPAFTYVHKTHNGSVDTFNPVMLVISSHLALFPLASPPTQPSFKPLHKIEVSPGAPKSVNVSVFASP